MSRRLQIVAVVLPIVLLVGMIGRAEWQLANSETWHFAIRGYDPRDLLRGHYMRFRLDVPVQSTMQGPTGMQFAGFVTEVTMSYGPAAPLQPSTATK